MGKALPKQGNTVKSWILTAFKENKQILQASLHQALSSISCSFDLWTSPNSKSILGIVVHWMDPAGASKNALLALRCVKGSHSGINQGNLVWTIFTEYNINKFIGYFTLDNASNNLSCLDHLSIQFNLALEGTGQSFETESRYIRCFGHVLNLVVRVFLYGKKSLRLGGNTGEKEAIAAENYAIDEWRKVGPLGKLRNLITWIRGSPQRLEGFANTVELLCKEVTNARKLTIGSPTRWNGDFLAIERALLMRRAIDIYIAETLTQDPRISIHRDQLTSEDWIHLTNIAHFLEPFTEKTLKLQGHRPHGALYDVYPSLERLRKHIALALEFYSASPLMVTPLTLANEKLNKYYSKNTLSPILCASLVLNPDMALFFQVEWDEDGRQDWTQKAHQLVRNLWEKNYKVNLSPALAFSPFSSQASASTTPAASPFPASTSTSRCYKRVRLAPTTIDDDELSRYLRLMDTNITITDPKAWWLANRADFPNLSRLAFDTFCVPAMSAEVERVFSRFGIPFHRVFFFCLFFSFNNLSLVRKSQLPTVEIDSARTLLKQESARSHGHKPALFHSKMLPQSPRH